MKITPFQLSSLLQARGTLSQVRKKIREGLVYCFDSALADSLEKANQATYNPFDNTWQQLPDVGAEEKNE